MFEFSVGGASTHGPEMFWQEEGVVSANPSVKRRGNLYIAAEGSPSECLMAIKAIRDQYYGDAGQPQGGNTAALRQSLDAANLILGKRSGIGVSIISAAVSEWGQLTLLRAGDCQGFVYSSQDGELLRLGDRQSADKALGRKSEAQFAETKRVLRDKDIVILCSGALVDSLTEEDMHSVAVLYAGEGPEVIARRLVEKASLDDNGGISTALVLLCRGTGMGIEPTLPLSLGTGVRGQGTGDRERGTGDGPPAPNPQPLSSVSRLRLPTLDDAGRMPFIAGAAAVLIAALLLARPLLSGSSGGLTSAPSTAAYEVSAGNGKGAAGGSVVTQPTLETPEAIWTKVDSLWKKGEGGDIAAWKEIVSLLEQLQTRTPTDQRIVGKLGSAKTNLVYAQRMQEATTYWGTGDTKASTTTNWARVVSTLETLLAYPLPTPLSSNQLSTAKKSLYAARVNYGKALEDAKRKEDARVQYERARELDPTRPEAVDAIKRLSR